MALPVETGSHAVDRTARHLIASRRLDRRVRTEGEVRSGSAKQVTGAREPSPPGLLWIPDGLGDETGSAAVRADGPIPPEPRSARRDRETTRSQLGVPGGDQANVCSSGALVGTPITAVHAESHERHASVIGWVDLGRPRQTSCRRRERKARR
jgi:hypothetical protein